MSITNIWNQQINTEDIAESFPDILKQVCQNLQYILLNEDRTDIETTSIIITYKIEQKVSSKRNKLKSLGKYKKIKKDETNKQCSICLDHFQCGKYKRKMPNCSHEFHKTCIDRWLYKDQKLTCPICRCCQKPKTK